MLSREDVWFEDELITDAALMQATAKNVFTPDQKVHEVVRGIVRVGQPRWQELDPQEYPFLNSNQNQRYFLVRLAFEFDLTNEGRQQNARFIYARCQAAMWGAANEQPPPRVYELFPREIKGGERQTITLKLKPQLTFIKAVEGSLGEISTTCQCR